MKTQELLDRYIAQMTKYLTYENAKRAREDILFIIEEHFKDGYDYESLEKFLNELGSPYNYSLRYEKANIFISGKNYEIFINFLKLMSVEILISNIIYFLLGGFYKVEKTEILNSIKILVLTIFTTGVLSSFISERVKNLRIMTSLVKDFSVRELYTEKKKITRPLDYIYMALYSLLIFIGIQYSVVNSLSAFKKALQIVYFMLILRDVNRISEVYYGKFINTLSTITDAGAVILIYKMVSEIGDKTFKTLFLLLIITIVLDLLKSIYNRTQENKNKSQKR